MAYVKVDYNKFEHAASAIDTYVAKHKSNMNKMNAEIEGLASTWKGVDYSAVRNEWNQMIAGDSTSGQMLQALNRYAAYLRAVGKAYQDAQKRAIDRANGLPR